MIGLRNLFVLACLTLLVANCANIGPAGTIMLTAGGPNTAVAVEAPVTINLRLENRDNRAWQLSDWLPGSYRIVSLTRNGQPVPVRQATGRFYRPLDVTLPEHLRVVAPSDALQVAWTSADDPGLGGQALSEVIYDPGGRHQVRYWRVGLTGDYVVTLRYQYPIGQSSGSAVHTGTSNDAVATFSVR